MNNKRLGTAFERKMCEVLAEKGYWVHFISPDARGAQPFDIIAVRDNSAMAIDCKTCKDHIFRVDRLEDNQCMAFGKWTDCGNIESYIAVLYNDKIYMIGFWELQWNEKIDLDKRVAWHDISGEV